MQKTNAFRFKQFSVAQERSAMKVGTDGVLLGAWVSSGDALQRVLDIGTGTGVVALMLAQRTVSDTDPCVIDAVEVDPEASSEAAGNFAASPWASRLRVHTAAIQTYAAEYPGERYDLIVSNPPYFMAGTDFRRGNGQAAADVSEPAAARVAARHAEMLPYDDLIGAVLALLKPDGRFAAIFPYRESGIFIAKAADRGLFVRRLLEIQGAPRKPIKRVAIECALSRASREAIVRERLCIEDGRGAFTEAYRLLTRDFYLKF